MAKKQAKIQVEIVVRFFNIKVLIVLVLFLFNINFALAEEGKRAGVNFSISLPAYLQISTVTNSVLTANITDETGNLYAPLQSRFKVISNSGGKQTLYLRASTVTQNGQESAIFEYGGRVYVAFAHVASKPTAQSLANCKLGAGSKESPRVVAYPITSIIGAEHRYKRAVEGYEVYVGNGVTDISVNIGSNVLINSFDKNDPKGFYQATLSLTEADI